jgi:hypothetical protein
MLTSFLASRVGKEVFQARGRALDVWLSEASG